MEKPIPKTASLRPKNCADGINKDRDKSGQKQEISHKANDSLIWDLGERSPMDDFRLSGSAWKTSRGAIARLGAFAVLRARFL